MFDLTINGLKVSCHFGMHFTQVFPKVLMDLQPVSDIDFATEAIWISHQNHCKAFGSATIVKKHEVFAWVEASYKDEAQAKVLSDFIEAYNASDFGKAISEANKAIADEDAKKKQAGKKLKPLPSE
jgi:hypothetical protein